MHAPIELSFLLCKFIAREGCYLEFTPTGGRHSFSRPDGLVLPRTYSAYAKEARLVKILKNELDKKKENLKHMNMC